MSESKNYLLANRLHLKYSSCSSWTPVWETRT